MKQTAVEYLQKELPNANRKKSIEDTYLEAKEIEKENMIDFLKSVFGMEGFDYEKYYYDFISRRKNTKEELPKTEIDWSGFPKSTQEKVGFTEPNIVDYWLDKNGNPEITKQVEEEGKKIFDDLDNEILKNKRL